MGMKSTKKFSKLVILSVAAFLFLAAPLAVLANNGKAIIVAENEIVQGNFIKAGATIDIAGNVNGDVIVAGNSVTISGDVAGDVIAAGNTVRILGEVSGSIRVIGSAIEINNRVGHNVWAAGSTVSLGAESEVDWDVFAAGASVELRGPIKRSAWLAGADIFIDNTVGQDVNATLDQDGQVILNAAANIKGNLIYKANDDSQLVQQAGSVVTGETTRKDLKLPNEKDLQQFFGMAFVMFKIFALFSLLVIGLVFISLVPKYILMVKDEMINKPTQSLGYGLIYILALPLVMLVLVLTIIGIPLAVVLVPTYFISIYIAKVFAAFGLGVIILDKITNKKYKGPLVWQLVVGLVVFVFLTSIPGVGWVISLVFVLWALGGIVKVKREILKEYR